MTTSGITTIQYTRDELITAALRKLGRIAAGQTPTGSDISDGAMALNTWIAFLRSKGMPLWTRAEYSFSLTNNVSTYQIGLGKTLNTAYPLKLLQAFRLDSSTTKTPIDIVPRFNYNLYPLGSNATPIQLTYQPFINYGEIKVWPTPDTTAAANTTIYIDYQAPFEYFTGGTQTMGFPEEWYLAVIYLSLIHI